ncbi:MAG: COG4705 family protein [Marmoricola sp.]
MTVASAPRRTSARDLLNKVPEVTLYFWVIKCLCTTIGETLSDNLMSRMAVGGDNASPDQLQTALYKVAAGTVVVLVALLVLQFRLRRYVPVVYWSAIVVISLVGTQITDMFEGQGDQPQHMWGITIVSLTLLALVFAAWWWVERTLSMHSIRTPRREMFYWLAILVTFATGTAVGDLIAEKFSLGYLTTLLLFVVLIALIAAAWRFTGINGVLAFWLAYIMTRPLGASTGDWLSQKGDQGLDLGTNTTSYLFLAVIVALVLYLQVRKPDVTPPELVAADDVQHHHRGLGHLEPRGPVAGPLGEPTD